MGRILVKKRKKKHRFLRKFLLAILILFFSIVGFGVYLAIQTLQAAGESYDDLGREKSDLRDDAVSISSDPVSILLMGVEDYSTNGDNGRTDTLMVATFNPDDEKLKLLSIPRDTMVEIVGKGFEDKITHAHAYGGKKMTIETVERFLGVPIDYYATVNFDAFKNVVDILGGISVNVPFDFEQNSDDRKAEKLQFHEGEMELDGRYALAFARMRKQDPLGDIGRNDRQQIVIKAIINKALSVGTITKIDDLAKEIGKNIETNMSIREGLGFYKNYSNFNINKIDKLTLETYPERINGISYQIADEASLEEVKTALRKHLEIDFISANDSLNNHEEASLDQ